MWRRFVVLALAGAASICVGMFVNLGSLVANEFAAGLGLMLWGWNLLRFTEFAPGGERITLSAGQSAGVKIAAGAVLASVFLVLIVSDLTLYGGSGFLPGLAMFGAMSSAVLFIGCLEFTESRRNPPGRLEM